MERKSFPCSDVRIWALFPIILRIILHYRIIKFTGNLKDHVSYEEVLKHSMRRYVSQKNVENQPLIRMTMNSVDDICNFIKNCHMEYIRMTENGQDIDCRHSVEVCRQVLEAVMALLHEQRQYCMQTA